MKPTRLLQLLIVFAVLTVNLVAGNINNWIGPHGGAWSQSANWSLGAPGPFDDVVIYTGGSDYCRRSIPIRRSIIDGGRQQARFRVGDGHSLTPKTLTLAGGLNVYNNATLLLQRTIIMAGASSQNAGDIHSSPERLCDINGNFDNVGFGVLGLDQGSSFVVNGTLTNSGTIQLADHLIPFGGTTDRD